MDILGTISGIIGIAGTVFSFWVWYKSKQKVAEITRALDIIRDISGTAIWETETALLGNSERRLQQSEKILGNITDIHKVAVKFIDKDETKHMGESLGQLIERGIIWNQGMVWAIEVSREIEEIWLITPDLKPDASDKEDGELVNRNLKNGKKYIYFFPNDLPDLENEIKRLRHNIGATGSGEKFAKQLTFISLPKNNYGHIFSKGNIVLYFGGKNPLPRCFEEVILTQVSERGLFWQEHAENKSREIRATLNTALQEFGG
jgi:hypothetical protein